MTDKTKNRNHGYIYLYAFVVAVLFVLLFAGGSSFLGSYAGSLVIGVAVFGTVYLIDRRFISRRR